MKYHFLKISFSLLLVLNYNGLVNAQDNFVNGSASLIPSNIYTPSTNPGYIQIIQKTK